MKVLFTFVIFLILSAILTQKTFAGTHSMIDQNIWSEVDSVLGLQDYEGDYNFEKELQRLKSLVDEGKELRLVIGRGSKEEVQLPLPQLDNVVWVYGNYDGKWLNSKDSSHNLWMNFSNADHLNLIDSELFSQIIVDYSTVKFLYNEFESNLKQYSRILKKGGKLFFEGISYFGMHFDNNQVLVSGDLPTGYSIHYSKFVSNIIISHEQFESFEDLWGEYSMDWSDTISFVDFLRKKNIQSQDLSSLLSEEFIQFIDGVIKSAQLIEEQTHDDAYAEIMRRYKVKFPTLGFNNVTFHKTGQYPIVTTGGFDFKYFEATKAE